MAILVVLRLPIAMDHFCALWSAAIGSVVANLSANIFVADNARRLPARQSFVVEIWTARTAPNSVLVLLF